LRITAAGESGVAEDLAAALHNRGAGASPRLCQQPWAPGLSGRIRRRNALADKRFLLQLY
jgi:hypothetical protein